MFVHSRIWAHIRACGMSLACLMGSVGLMPVAQAQTYPDRPVSVVVGFAPGGATDILARLVTKVMADDLGQPFVVENRAGANSNIGVDYVLRQKNDGYTVHAGSISNAINNTLYTNLRFDFPEDFQPIGMMANMANVLVVHPDRPYQSVDALIAYAKAHPGEVTCASAGVGSSIHMSCELFKLQTGTDILHVPYRGSGPAVVDLVGGQVDIMFDNLPSVISHIRAGTLMPLAVTTAQRQVSLPDVPTFIETGLDEFVVEAWFGLSVLQDTPEDRIEVISDALNRALKNPELIEAFAQNGFLMPPQPNTPQTYHDYVREETRLWGDVVRKSGVTAQ